jgi:hypothetical protein
MASGQVAGSVEQRARRLDSTDLTDGKWHQLKMYWEFDKDTSLLNSGQVNLDVWIDNVSIINSDNLAFGGSPQTMSSGMEYIVGFAASGFSSEAIDRGGNFSAPGYFDEIRLSSGEQLGHTFQPEYSLSYEDYVTWFRRTRKLDTQTISPEQYLFSGTAPNMVPVGFRLKNDDSNIASTLDQRTFLDINDPLPSGLYEI